jgi:iron complex transport system ATP-binding protein
MKDGSASGTVNGAGAAKLEFADVTVRRGTRVVLQNLSFSLSDGEILAVIGPNGSGKSSLVMAAAGLLVATNGTIRLGGRDLASLTAPLRARAVAYVPQRSELVAPLAVRTVVAMGRYAAAGAAFGEAPAQETAQVDAALAAVDASHLAERSFAELSGGEAQRVLIARALATGADILLLDEPTSALDLGHRLALDDILRKRAQAGDAVLVALHDLNEARALADRVLLLDRGTRSALGAPDEVIAPAPIRAVYGVDLIPNHAHGFRRAGPAPAPASPDQAAGHP